MSDNAPGLPRPRLQVAAVENVTADHVQVGGKGWYAMLRLGPVEFYFPNHEGAHNAARRKTQLEQIERLGAAIVAQASAALEMLDQAVA